MSHFLRKVILFIEDSKALASCKLLVERCNEAGIGIEVFSTGECLEQLETYREQALYISDRIDCIRAILDKGLPALIYYHTLNREETFPKCRYAMENPQDIDAEYLERVFRRYMNLPWDILETERCILRESTVGDVEAFWEIYKEPAITAYTEGLKPTIEEEEAYIRDYISNIYQFYEFGVWTVVDKGTKEIIGRAGLSVRDGYDIPELGYVIRVAFQHQGYAYEVCRAIMDYAAEYLGCPQVGALVHWENEPSIGLLKKLGFTHIKAQDEQLDYYISKEGR